MELEATQGGMVLALAMVGKETKPEVEQTLETVDLARMKIVALSPVLDQAVMGLTEVPALMALAATLEKGLMRTQRVLGATQRSKIMLIIPKTMALTIEVLDLGQITRTLERGQTEDQTIMAKIMVMVLGQMETRVVLILTKIKMGKVVLTEMNKAPMVLDQMAVSYTHLTLPTIYTV